MTFTNTGIAWIEEKIQTDLDILCDLILEYVDPISILLLGSFGRGEGSVLVKDGEALPMKDYDLLLVFHKSPNQELIKQIENEAYERLNYSKPANRDFLYSEFVIDIDHTTIDKLTRFSHVAVYEIKSNSMLLFGLDVRNDITLGIDDISPTAGLHFLFMKCIGLLSHFSMSLFNNGPDSSKRNQVIYECGKTYIEICTALSLLGGFYSPSYHERSISLDEKYSSAFSDLHEQIPDLSNKISYFTKLKLRPNIDIYDTIDVLDLWFQTRDDLLAVLLYYLNQLYQKKEDDFSLIIDVFQSSLVNTYLFSIIEYYLYKGHNINNRIITSILNYLYHRYHAFLYSYNLFISRRRLKLCSLNEAVIIKIYLLTTCLLGALNKEGVVDNSMMVKFANEMTQIGNVEHDYSLDTKIWSYYRGQLLFSFKLYEGQR